MRITVLLAAFLALGACEGPKEIHVSSAWVRLPTAPGRPAAAYFTLHGGATDATLISVSSEVAIKAEIHETGRSGNMSSMKPIGQLPLPAGSDLVFAPGGKHVMLFDVNPRIKPSALAPLLFTFADGRRVVYKATVIGAGDAPPGS